MNKKRSVATLDVGGKERTVKFGTNQSVIFTELRGIQLAEYMELLKNVDEGKVDLAFTRDVMYSALVDGARVTKVQVDFTKEDVGDWIDENPETQAILFKIMVEGNGPNENRETTETENP